MNHWMWAVSLVGILSTAVVLGTDMFFLTCGRPALKLASSSDSEPSANGEITLRQATVSRGFLSCSVPKSASFC